MPVPPSSTPLNDYRHADPAAIVSRQLTLLDWAQQAMRNEMQRAMGQKGSWIGREDVDKLEKLSNGIVRAITALQKMADLTDELARRMTPEQLLEAALRKVEGQDLATIRYAIKRLRAYHNEVGIKGGAATAQQGGPMTAAESIAGLDDV